MRNVKFLLILSVIIGLASCSSMKLASSEGKVVTPAGSNKPIEVYTFKVEKDAQKIIEIDEVRLVNTETGWSQSVGFTIKNESGKDAILSTKGYTKFTIECKNPNTEGTVVQANKAIVTYHYPEKDKKTMDFDIQ